MATYQSAQQVKGIVVLRNGAQVDREGNIDCNQHGGNCCASGYSCQGQAIKDCRG